ncbi:acyl carrier protein [Hahella sp. KA22]|uniref:Acyl carrier protein n=1 Tax=Hahella chejuensis (strain KCTC 2396) TaxID=349521 RepID=Q2S967_HAHCH|nr:MULTISPECIES: acyl carrier protein [Hahella]ABC32807.1 Acyl carrier protein [Hahella chejuensis KCTC 2396]AZZ94566.1 acyl carrier protein [Hahella sp. KA22]MBU6952867.1 acyl carrier protein [Hahella sp. HN01]MDG9670178.1 acyl carrier protein [Hahella sp. CR1]QAY57939.1 acyl carrier protein [Hahella sp. KA22]
MSQSDTLERLKSVVGGVTRVDYEGVGLDEPLNLDSIQRISLIVALEGEFDIEIDSESLEPETFDTFGAMATYVAGCVAESAGV